MVAATVPVPLPEGTPGWTGYAAHALMYAALAGTLLWTGRRRGWSRPAASAFLLAVAYGVLHEGVQAFVPWRSASALDILADAVGAAAAIAADAARRRLS
jgi:VanZ family protein